MSETVDLLKTLRRLEKGELLASPGFEGMQAAAAQTRRVGPGLPVDTTGASKTDRSASKPPKSMSLNKSTRIAPTYESILSVPPDSAPSPVIVAPRFNAPLIPPDAMHKYTRLLAEETKKTRNATLAERAQTYSVLAQAHKFIPASFLKQYHLHEELKRSALEKMFRVCCILHGEFKKDALRQWHRNAKEVTTRRVNLAAVMIGKLLRGHRGRLIARQRRVDVKLQKERLLMEQYGSLILKLQRWARRVIGRILRAQRIEDRRRLAMIKNNDSFSKSGDLPASGKDEIAEKIIKRRKANQHFDKSKVYSIRETHACIVIQSSYRTHLAYLKTRRLRAKRHRDKMQRRLNEPNQAQAIYFEHHGAAIDIQRWFRRLPIQKQRRQAHRNKIKARILNAKVTMIQRVYRGHLGRKRVRALRLIYARAMLRKFRAAVRIQALYRRFKVRKRLTKAQLKKLRKAPKPSKFIIRRQQSEKLKTQRRLSFSFSNIVIRSLEHIDNMDKAAAKIQKCWRRIVRKKKVETTVLLVQHPAALKIARWLRSWLWRRRMKAAAKTIQLQWSKKLQEINKRKRAALSIQTQLRRKLATLFVVTYRKRFLDSVQRIQSWIRILIARRAVRHRVLIMRCKLEIRESGALQYEKSILCTVYDELWDVARKKKANRPSELHRLFAVNCSNGMIDLGKMQKILRDCNLIGTKKTDIDVQDVELTFTKVKSAGERKLDYTQYIDMLHELGTLKYIIKQPVDIDVDESTFRFCRKKGRAALVCKLVQDYIQRNGQYKAIEKELGPESSKKRGAQKAATSAVLIQRIGRGYLGRLRTKRVRESMRDALETDRRYSAKIRIQRFGRAYLGRRFLVRLAQQMYVKCMDPDSRVPYWFNPRTGTSSWTKPKLLKDLDCGETIRLPTENERFTLICKECETNPASQYCDECDKAMCGTCVKLLHKAAIRQGHTQVPLEMCIECEFQVPTRHCVACGDAYCDTCFQHVHRRGRLKLHTYHWLIDPCQNCAIRAGAWRITNPSNIFHVVKMCTICYIESNDGECPQNRTGGVLAAEYKGPAIQRFRKEKDDEAHRERMAEQDRLRVITMANLKRLRAAENIQRIFRGWVCRVQFSDFVEKRKAFFILRAQEMSIRQGFLYRLRDYFGIAPSLLSDTPKERVLKLYPHFLHPTVTDCLEAKWWIATKYLERLDRRRNASVKNGGRVTVTAGMSALLSLWVAQYRVRRCRSMVAHKEKAHEMRRKQYRDARSAAKVDEKKKKRLQKLAHDELNNVEAAKLKLEDSTIKLDEAEMKWEIFAGPRGIQRMISKRRKEGIILPFSLSLIKNCRFAKVSLLAPDKSRENEMGYTSNVALTPDGEVKWSKYLKYGDTVRISGSYFKIISGDAFLTAYDESNEVGSERVELKVQRDELEGEHDSDEEEKENDHAVAFECKKVTRETDGLLFRREAEELMPIENADHLIKLDRVWVLESCSGIEIRKITKKPAHARIPFQFSQAVRSSLPSQVFITCSVIFLNKLSRFLSVTVSSMDDESEFKSSVETKAAEVVAIQNSLLKMSSTPINLNNHGYTIRQIVKVLRAIKNASVSGFHYIAEEYRKYRDKVEIDPFELWDASGEKSVITVLLDSDYGEPSVIGSFEMDVDAPCSVMRIYLHKRFRDKLNQETGDSFLFFNIIEGNETILDREDEENKESQEMIKLKIDDITEEQTRSITIIRNKAEEFVLIPEFVDTSAKEDVAVGQEEPVLSTSASAHYF